MWRIKIEITEEGPRLRDEYNKTLKSCETPNLFRKTPATIEFITRKLAEAIKPDNCACADSHFENTYPVAGTGLSKVYAEFYEM